MEEQEQTNEGAAAPARLRVGVAYNLKNSIVTGPPDSEAEFDDPETIQAIKTALINSGCEVELLEADKQFPARLLQCKPDIVFNIAEGRSGRGREAHVPAMLNFFGIPFTGSDEATMCISMDKPLAKKLLSIHHVPTPKYKVYKYYGQANNRATARGLRFPVIIKPAAEGSGKGISGLSIAHDVADLHAALSRAIADYKQDMLIEEFISGREFTVAIIGDGRNVRAFPPMEIVFLDKEHNIYSYETKRRFKEFVEYKCPPDMDGATLAELARLARRVYDVLECRDFARVDFRMDSGGALYFIEINTLPGLAPGYSDLPILAELCGMGYRELIISILNSALTRYGMPIIQ